MKTKTIILLSVCALVVLFQGIGAGYAYHSLKEKAGVALKAAFRKAFDTLVDEQVNALPYPDGTVTHLIYTPADSLYRQDASGQKSLIDGVPPENISFPVSAQVELPQCALTLSLMPAGGWSFGARITAVVVVSLLAALMLTALLRAWFTLAQQKRSLENLVDLDPLTNLRNRRSLHSSIERRCLAGKPFALLYIDLDKFKNINDTYGHQVGDGFLLAFVQRILPCLSGADVMFRLGGDEFLIVCPHARLRQRLADIDAALRAPLDVNGLPLPCFYSVGIAVYPEDGLQPETLLQYADERMYEDKKRRQNDG